MRAIADGVAVLVRGPTLVWPEGTPRYAGATFHVRTIKFGQDPDGIILTIKAGRSGGQSRPNAG
jgi:hypothetical protein